MNTKRIDKSRPRRTGLSTLEWVGCIVALICGMWLGAMFLGIDLHQTAYTALSESELLEKVPEKWRPSEPEGTEGAPTSTQLARNVQTERASLHGEIAALRSPHEAQPADAANASKDSAATPANDSEAVAKQQTLAYWNRVHEIVREQAAMQREAEAAATEGNATKLATLKGRINRFTASALRALPSTDVDPVAHDMCKDLADWYERWAVLYEDAVGLWESAALSESGSLSKDWESAHLQLRNEGRLLSDKLAAVRDSLNRRFGEEFANIAGL